MSFVDGGDVAEDTNDIASRLRIKKIGSMEVVMVSSDTNVLDAVNSALDFKGQDDLTIHEVVKEIQRRAQEYERVAMPEFQKFKRMIRRQALEEAADKWEAYSGTGPGSDAPWMGKWLRGLAAEECDGE